MLTEEQQTAFLHDAACLSNMNGHIQTDGSTAAERVMQMFGGKRNTPRKMSYLFCDAVDACFYYSHDKACCTFTARWFADSADLGKLGAAGEQVKAMLSNMQALVDGDMKQPPKTEQ